MRTEALLNAIDGSCTRPWTLMEVCGGQTHALLRHGIDQRLPPAISLIHGPGCPVCVTASEKIDQAIALAKYPQVILCSFGDMVRVPGSHNHTLLAARAEGGDVRVIYSPLDVLNIARCHPERLVVFFAVGFETTAPATALLAQRTLASELRNVALLVCHVRVPPVLEVMLGDQTCNVQAVLAAGHVCTVMGQQEYSLLAARHRRPIVVTGFEIDDLLLGIWRAICQLERGQHRVENSFRRVAKDRGNGAAQELLSTVFEPIDTPWRGLGLIPSGGLALRPPYDALAIENQIPELKIPELPIPDIQAPDRPITVSNQVCLSREVLQGLLRPQDCPSFGRQCTPTTPLGAPMVSSEGACAAYARYRF